MWTSRLIGVAILGAAILVLALPGNVAADEGMPVRFHELIQQGEGVDVTLKYETYFEAPGSTYPVLFRRSDVNGTHVLLDYEALTAEDVTDTSVGWCWSGDDEEYCEGVDWCEDCDGNDIPECPGDCAYTHYYLYIDECVPPGLVTYRVQGEETYWPFNEEIDVEDVGQDCPVPPASDADADADADANGEGGDDSGCSVSGVGDGSGVAPLAVFVMLVVGLVALVFGRKRS